MDTPHIKFIASVEEESKHDINQLAKQLEGLGCQISQVLSITGIISGSIAAKDLEVLKIKGIQSVDVEREVRRQQ